MVRHILKGHTGQIRRLYFTSDGKKLLSAASDGTVKLWDVHSWTELCALTDHKSGIISLALCPNRSLAATGDSDSKVILWNLESHRQKAVTTAYEFITAIAFDPNEDKVLFTSQGSGKNTLIMWNYDNDTQVIIPGEWDNVVSVTSPSLDKKYITGGMDGSVVIWDQLFTKRLQTLPMHCCSGVLLSAVSHNGRLAVYWPADHVGIIWDLQFAKKICDFKSPLMNTISSVCLSPSGNLLILTGCTFTHEPGVIELVDATSGRLLRSLRSHQGFVSSAAISPDEILLATGGELENHLIKIWSLQDLLHTPDHE